MLRDSPLLFMPLCMLAAGCLFDPDDRCGPNQVFAGKSTCVCAEGYRLGADGKTCEEVPMAAAGLGDACESADDCIEPYDVCASEDDGGYCTTACEASTDCETGWSCDSGDGEGFCHEPPTGLGMSCESDDDCDGLEASLCETFQSMACQIAGCTADAPCPSGYVCCDLTPTGFFDGTQCIEGATCAVGEIVE